ncbi:MOSC domain-containing protein [Dyadobacter luteus]|uniref:MOSC domain-containing protein n=1 Tax=Dyadobacter luteus TaxID=2259619 RepID=UPI002697B306|nr:MOSC N-terminal beta barrel domain-containing protein [Dyadobacter luteus]
MITLSEIWIYPVKSLAGIRLSEAEVQSRGLRFDRRWMIVDEEGVFLTQRTFSKMALIDVTLESNTIRLHSRTDKSFIDIPLQPEHPLEISVKVWDDVVPALTVSKTADEWLSKQLEKQVTLVVMPDSTKRKADPKYAKNDENVSFADGFPYLIISQAALDNLNRKIDSDLEMKRFRPNFVISGTEPHAEDNWSLLQIGDIEFEIVKPCARCVLTTIDPETGIKGAEPLKTLAGYRRVNNKIMFGQNAVAKQNGLIRQDALVSVLKTSE